MPPETCYAKSGDVHIAYQVVGDGPIDLVYVPGWISHVEYLWELPATARALQRLASFSRLILFDKRGTGLSDRVPEAALPTTQGAQASWVVSRCTGPTTSVCPPPSWSASPVAWFMHGRTRGRGIPMSDDPPAPADVVRHAAAIAHHLADTARLHKEPEEAAWFEQLAAVGEARAARLDTLAAITQRPQAATLPR
jgi:pimeloyl-ACP methyl ester carboxylesterase